jgi:hypothetical protein
VNSPPSLSPLSENERAAWRKQNLHDLAESVALSFEEKIAILEDLEQRLIGMGYQRDGATGRLYKPHK